MRRMLTSLSVAIALFAATVAPVSGHTETQTDPQDLTDSALDIASATFGHADKVLTGTVTTYLPFELGIFANDLTNFYIDIYTKKGDFYLMIWHTGSNWTAKVFEYAKGPDDRVGKADVDGYGTDGIWFSVKRKTVGAKKGSKVRWYATTGYQGGSGSCAAEACFDYLPNNGTFKHKT